MNDSVHERLVTEQGILHISPCNIVFNGSGCVSFVSPDYGAHLDGIVSKQPRETVSNVRIAVCFTVLSNVMVGHRITIFVTSNFAAGLGRKGRCNPRGRR